MVGALYGDSKGVLYSFSLKKDYLKLDRYVFKFMKKYDHIIIKLNHYEWAKFLEKVNLQENSFSITEKLDQATKRNNLDSYKQLLFKELAEKQCFYYGREVKFSNIHVDHFIPWSLLEMIGFRI